MECKDGYVERIVEKYNRKHVTAFVRKNAEQKFLGPFGLRFRASPSFAFGNSTILLDPKEEFRLFTALHFMKYKLKKSRRHRDRYFDIYIALRNRGISANWALVPNCIEKHTRRFSYADLPTLMEKGNEALIAAVDCFDPWMGFRFSTYGCNAILKSFLRKPSVSPTTSPIDDKLSDALADKRVDDNQELWLERLETIMRLHLLAHREKEVLMYRFGCFGHKIDNDKGRLTLEEVAQKWNVTKERVRQIQVEALRKLREKLSIDTILY